MYPSRFSSHPGLPAPVIQSTMTPPIANMSHPCMPPVNPASINTAFNTNRNGIPSIPNIDPQGTHPAFNIGNMDAFRSVTFGAAPYQSGAMDEQRINYNTLIQSRIESHQINMTQEVNGNCNFGEPPIRSIIQASHNTWSFAEAPRHGQWTNYEGTGLENRKRAHPETIPITGPQNKRVTPGPAAAPPSEQLREEILKIIHTRIKPNQLEKKEFARTEQRAACYTCHPAGIFLPPNDTYHELVINHDVIIFHFREQPYHCERCSNSFFITEHFLHHLRHGHQSEDNSLCVTPAGVLPSPPTHPSISPHIRMKTPPGYSQVIQPTQFAPRNISPGQSVHPNHLNINPNTYTPLTFSQQPHTAGIDHSQTQRPNDSMPNQPESLHQTRLRQNQNMISTHSVATQPGSMQLQCPAAHEGLFASTTPGQPPAILYPPNNAQQLLSAQDQYGHEQCRIQVSMDPNKNIMSIHGSPNNTLTSNQPVTLPNAMARPLPPQLDACHNISRTSQLVQTRNMLENRVPQNNARMNIRDNLNMTGNTLNRTGTQQSTNSLGPNAQSMPNINQLNPAVHDRRPQLVNRPQHSGNFRQLKTGSIVNRPETAPFSGRGPSVVDACRSLDTISSNRSHPTSTNQSKPAINRSPSAANISRSHATINSNQSKSVKNNGRSPSMAKASRPHSVANSNLTTPPRSVSNINRTTPQQSVANINRTTPPQSVANINRTTPPRSVANLNRTTPPRSVANSNRTTPPRSVADSNRTTPPRSVANSNRTTPPRSVANSNRTTPPRSVANSNRTTPPRSVANLNRLQPTAHVNHNVLLRTPPNREPVSHNLPQWNASRQQLVQGIETARYDPDQLTSRQHLAHRGPEPVVDFSNVLNIVPIEEGEDSTPVPPSIIKRECVRKKRHENIHISLVDDDEQTEFQAVTTQSSIYPPNNQSTASNCKYNEPTVKDENSPKHHHHMLPVMVDLTGSPPQKVPIPRPKSSERLLVTPPRASLVSTSPKVSSSALTSPSKVDETSSNLGAVPIGSMTTSMSVPTSSVRTPTLVDGASTTSAESPPSQVLLLTKSTKTPNTASLVGTSKSTTETPNVSTKSDSLPRTSTSSPKSSTRLSSEPTSSLDVSTGPLDLRLDVMGIMVPPNTNPLDLSLAHNKVFDVASSAIDISATNNQQSPLCKAPSGHICTSNITHRNNLPHSIIKASDSSLPDIPTMPINTPLSSSVSSSRGITTSHSTIALRSLPPDEDDVIALYLSSNSSYNNGHTISTNQPKSTELLITVHSKSHQADASETLTSKTQSSNKSDILAQKQVGHSAKEPQTDMLVHNQQTDLHHSNAGASQGNIPVLTPTPVRTSSPATSALPVMSVGSVPIMLSPQRLLIGENERSITQDEGHPKSGHLKSHTAMAAASFNVVDFYSEPSSPESDMSFASTIAYGQSSAPSTPNENRFTSPLAAANERGTSSVLDEHMYEPIIDDSVSDDEGENDQSLGSGHMTPDSGHVTSDSVSESGMLDKSVNDAPESCSSKRYAPSRVVHKCKCNCRKSKPITTDVYIVLSDDDEEQETKEGTISLAPDVVPWE